MNHHESAFDRRRFMAFFGGLGLAGSIMPRLVWAEVEEKGSISLEALRGAEEIAGLEFTDSERELMMSGIEDLRKDYETLRGLAIDNSVSPALHFDPVLPGMEISHRTLIARAARPEIKNRPPDDPFLPVLAKGDLRSFEQSWPVMHLHRVKPKVLAEISDLDRNQLGNVIGEKLESLFIEQQKASQFL